MGCMQGVALLPGVSRSGSTLAGGLLSGLNRKSAAKFSLLSLGFYARINKNIIAPMYSPAE